jgi:hypothetical protein
MKNQYVSLEPLPKEKFECINVLIRDASVQVIYLFTSNTISVLMYLNIDFNSFIHHSKYKVVYLNNK